MNHKAGWNGIAIEAKPDAFYPDLYRVTFCHQEVNGADGSTIVIVRIIGTPRVTDYFASKDALPGLDRLACERKALEIVAETFGAAR